MASTTTKTGNIANGTESAAIVNDSQFTRYFQDYISQSDTDEDGEVISVTSSDECPEPPVRRAPPPTPLFTAHLSTSLTKIKPSRAVIYDVINANVGNLYNASTGRFKANVNGFYAFFATISTNKKMKLENESLCLIHNFHPADKSMQGTMIFEKGSYRTKTMQSVLKLKEGDEIWAMRLTTSADNYKIQRKNFYSTFSASLLEKDKSVY